MTMYDPTAEGVLYAFLCVQQNFGSAVDIKMHTGPPSAVGSIYLQRGER